MDQTIAARGKKTAALLQTLRDNGARSGSAQLTWTDIDEASKALRINCPEKGSDSRTLEVSDKTLAMLRTLPKKYEPYVFNPNAAIYKEH